MENWVNETIGNTTALRQEMEETNTSIYYTVQNSNPELADCEPTILKVEVKVWQFFMFIARLSMLNFGTKTFDHQKFLLRILCGTLCGIWGDFVAIYSPIFDREQDLRS